MGVEAAVFALFAVELIEVSPTIIPASTSANSAEKAALRVALAAY